MTERLNQSPLQTKPQRMITFTGGGWVLVLTAIISLGLFTWAMAPAIFRTINRPPGDGKNIDSYKFDLSNLTVPRHLVAPAMLHRDMAPVMTNPTSSDVAAMQRVNDPKYGKYLVGSDLVIGVEIDGNARAYPINVMYVHEIINDRLGPIGKEIPIAVTYNWLSDSAVVFDRRVGDKTLTFHVSGLVYNSNLLMYETVGDPQFKAPEEAAHGRVADSIPQYRESLWSQLLGRAISGPAADEHATLEMIPCEVVRWDDWAPRKPHTTVLNRNLNMAARYKDAAPTRYFQSENLLFPVSPMPPAQSPPPKTRVLAVEVGEARLVYPMPLLLERAKESGSAGGEQATRTWSDTLGGATLHFTFDQNWQLPHVRVEPPEAPWLVTHSYWFAWHAMHPDDQWATRDE